MALTYDEARKIGEDRYSTSGSTSGIDEGYIKAIQNNDLQTYNQKLMNATPQRKESSSGGFNFNYTPMSQQDAYQKASNIINPQMQQLKNDLILKLSKQRTNNVTDLATRGQAVGGQRQLAEANISSEEALQGSNILLQGDTAKNQLAEQYIATANEEAQRQQALQYQQYMDSMNMDRQNRQDALSESQFNRQFDRTLSQDEIEQQNYEAEVTYKQSQDEIQNALDQGRLSISQAELALSQARFKRDSITSSGGGSSGSGSADKGMTDQEIKLEAIKRATSSDGTFDQNAFNKIYTLLKPVPFIEPRLVNGRGTTTSTTTPTATTKPTENDIYNRYASGKITENQYYAELDKYGY